MLQLNYYNDVQTLTSSLPANTAMPMFLTGCETEMHIWKYGECELLCVRVVNLLRGKDDKHTKSDVTRQYS